MCVLLWSTMVGAVASAVTSTVKVVLEPQLPAESRTEMLMLLLPEVRLPGTWMEALHQPRLLEMFWIVRLATNWSAMYTGQPPARPAVGSSTETLRVMLLPTWTAVPFT